MRPFRLLLEHPVYWSLNRRSVTRAFALGLFIAFVPMPIHLLLGAALALLLRLNVPAAVAGTLHLRIHSPQRRCTSARTGSAVNCSACRRDASLRNVVDVAHDDPDPDLETVAARLPRARNADRARRAMCCSAVCGM